MHYLAKIAREIRARGLNHDRTYETDPRCHFFHLSDQMHPIHNLSIRMELQQRLPGEQEQEQGKPS